MNEAPRSARKQANVLTPAGNTLVRDTQIANDPPLMSQVAAGLYKLVELSGLIRNQAWNAEGRLLGTAPCLPPTDQGSTPKPVVPVIHEFLDQITVISDALIDANTSLGRLHDQIG